VEAGLILDHDVQGGRIGIGDQLEQEGMDVPVDGRVNKSSLAWAPSTSRASCR
jgi:hypothetical protein